MAGSRMQDGAEDAGVADEEEEQDMEVEQDSNPYVGLDARAMEILKGCLEDLPRLPTKTVRIFLSSTFSDFKAERNILPKLAYPDLQSYCSDIGLDFQVVDMRWGVTDDAINDHQVSDLCIQEIKTCQQVSCGPNFVVLLGNRYGWQPFPARIEATMFESFLDIAERVEIPNKELLTQWFARDDNAVPPQYNLQPIYTHLKYYNDMTREGLREKDRAKWREIFISLRTILRQCATLAKHHGIIIPDTEKHFYISVTEEEMGQGVFKSEKPEQQVLCYIRALRGIEDDHNNPAAELFIDLDQSSHIDAFAQHLRRELHDKKIPPVLPECNIKRYKVNWTSVPLEDSQDSEHNTYLHDFCEDFKRDMRRLIDSAYEDYDDEEFQLVTSLYHEVLHHARFAMVKCEVFCGRSHELDQMHLYLKDTRENVSHGLPFLVYGKSGIGKTALLAKAAHHCPNWLGPSAVIILRFFGTSPQSSNIGDALKSMIYQICINFKYPLPKEEALENFGDVRREFWDLLERTAKAEETRPLVLILDSVDQLISTYGAHNMIWLPKAIPKNVYLITSMLSERFECLESSRKRFVNCSNFLELDIISAETGMKIIDVCLQQANRRLTAEQTNLVQHVFERNPQPLFLKLLMDNARTWHSYSPVSGLELGATVHDAITHLFEQQELKYGKTFVRHALGYLTCGRVGLTDVEMEDALSCDDKVLIEVYQYHDPPLEGVIRIPSLLWARLQHALKEYLADRQVDGKVVQAWYHRQFWEAAEHRYLSSLEEIEDRHRVLANIFLQESGIYRTIVLEQRGGKVIEDANRCVTPQPLTARNKRKLNSLPYHFACGNNIKMLKEKCLLNFEWLLIKLLSVNIGTVIKEYSQLCDTKSLKGHKDVELFRNFMDLCFDSLWHDPFLLAYHIKERLSKCARTSVLLEKMVRDATNWLETTHIPTLVPTHILNLAAPDSPLRFNILVGCTGKLTNDEVMMACNWIERNNTAKIQVLNLVTKDIVASIPTGKAVPFELTSDNRYFVFCESTFLKMCELDGGDVVSTFPYTEEKYENLSIRALALNSDNRLLALSVMLGKPANISVKEKWRKQPCMFLLNIPNKQVIKSVLYESKKIISSMSFVLDDTQIVCLSTEKVQILNATDLELLSSYDTFGFIFTNLFTFLHDSCLLAGPISHENVIKLLVFNYDNRQDLISKALHINSEKASPFCVKSKEDGSVHIAGTYNDNKSCCSLCVWDMRSNQTRKIAIAPQGLKAPNVLTVTHDWSHVFVGWNSGHISIVDLVNEHELFSVQSHGQAVNYMHMLSNSTIMITVAQDHCLKMWDTSCSIAIAHSAWEHKREIGLRRSNAISEIPTLDENEECLDVVTSTRCVVTAPKDTNQGPRFWSIENGELLEDITENCRKLFDSSSKENGVDFADSRTHGQLRLLEGELLLYTRKRRDCLSMFVTKDLASPTVCSLKFFKNSFFTLLPDLELFNNSPVTKMKVYIVGDEYLTSYQLPSLEEVTAIRIPSITEDVHHVMNAGGKRRLSNYRVGITCDTKYFLIVNPVGLYGKKAKRYFDLVDLHNQQYIKRIALPRYFPSTTMLASFMYLVQKASGDWALYPPTKLLELEQTESHTYRSLIYTERFISKDASIGIEFCNRSHSCKIWQLSPLQLNHTLTNHMHQLTCCDISWDNMFLVTGSYDKTVRVWSIYNGSQLCMFHTNGSVDQVLFNPLATHVIVQCYAAPQKKRGIILKFRNAKGKRKLSRFISKYDL